MQHIIVATDGSPGSQRAVDTASALAKATGCRLTIMTVCTSLSDRETIKLARAEGDAGDALEAIAGRILADAGDRARSCGAAQIDVRTQWGDAAEAIIDTATRETADMIVVGRRGHGRLAGLLLGSVSQKLVCLAPCTVAVVP